MMSTSVLKTNHCRCQFSSFRTSNFAFIAILIVVLVNTPLVLCHGFVQTVVVAGTAYPGWNPTTDPYANPVPERVIRKIPSDGPITDKQDSNLACNTGGETGAALVASASAGSEVKFEWTNWLSDHLGPVSTYMTSCGGDCTKFDVNGASWFKIDASGYSDGSWASTKLINDNNTWTSTIPSALADGQYLMRNEIVALHSTGSPQYYPSCTQVEVTGGGGKTPSSSETVKIPGLYDDVDFPDVWTQTLTTWDAPGPAVVSFADDTGDQNTGESSASGSNGVSSQTASNPQTTGTASGSSLQISYHQCLLSQQSFSTVRLSRRSLIEVVKNVSSDLFFVIKSIKGKTI